MGSDEAFGPLISQIFTDLGGDAIEGAKYDQVQRPINYNHVSMNASTPIIQDAEPQKICHLRDMRPGDAFRMVEWDIDVAYRLTERLTLEVRARSGSSMKWSDWAPMVTVIRALGNPRVWPVLFIDSKVEVK